jgi:hypothetical protein
MDLSVDTNVSGKHTASIIIVEVHFSPKDWYSKFLLPASPHGVTTQKININTFNTLIISNLIL